MAELAALGTIVSMAGTVAGGLAARNQANAEAKAATERAAWDADMAKRRGAEEMAAAQQTAGEERRKRDYVISEQRARAASSGGGATSATVLDLVGDVWSEGESRAKTATAVGKARQAGMADTAKLALWEGATNASFTKKRGKNAFVGSLLEAAGEGLKGGYEYKKARFG